MNVTHYAAPETLEELTGLLAGGDALVFAGGTDVMPQTRAGTRKLQPHLINMGRVSGLSGVSREGSGVVIGALATVTDLLESRIVREEAPVLAQAAGSFASGQVRNAATLGGNLCNASPAADLAIPLLLLDADVELASRENGTLNRRSVPLSELFLGPGKTCARATEILTRVGFDAPVDGFTARFTKFGTRPALDIAVVSVGVAGILDRGALVSTRVAFGACAPTPVRGRKTEAFLERRLRDENTIAGAAAIARDEISPISDVRASAWYRRELVKTLTERALRDVARA